MNNNQALKQDIDFLKRQKRELLDSLLIKGKQVEQLIELCEQCAMKLSNGDAYYVRSEIDRIDRMGIE